MRILYVQATFVPPPADPETDRFFLLSDTLEGDVLQPIWLGSAEEVEATFGPGSYPVYTRGRFRYHWFFAWRYKGIRQRLETFRFYMRKGLELRREHRYDSIVAYSHMTTALFAGILKLLMRTKLVVEIATSPENVYLAEHPRPTWKERLMHLYSDACLHLSMLLSDRAHFLYPDQLSKYPLLRKTPNTVFHEFVTVSRIDRNKEKESEPFVLLVGAPWYLKGVDLLVEAFQRLAGDFPEVKLKILGYFEDRAELDRLVGNSPQIEILKARPNPEVLKIISEARILVLASRCEGMGRVLIEAMGAAVPLIGSDVGGIPFMVRDGECGLVFHGGDAGGLEQKLRQLLGDPALRQRLGDNGYRRAHQELNEKVYVEQFTLMVEAAVRGDP
jgi:glycosyltransferase involved in cell wall biosynthesis